MDANFYGFDFNNGFEEVVLFPEDCCRKCMEAKKCVGWTRTATGQCWLKFHVPDDKEVQKLIGDVSGLRPSKHATISDRISRSEPSAVLKVECGQPIHGITYKMENPDLSIVIENVTDADQCCQHCANKHRRYPSLSLFSYCFFLGCHVWSFFPLEKKCVQNFNFDGVKTKHPNVTTAFMVTGSRIRNPYAFV